MSDPRQERLAEFVAWTRAHVTGDEKGQAQIFLDHLFRAFGQKGSLDVGGSPEMRVRKAEEDGGGTTFADYVWKPVVLIEMKRRGVDLAKHFRQAFDYWIRLVPNRPQYAVLSNFDEFWVYDFNVQMDAPVDKVTLDELPTRYGPLAFLFPTNETPVFGNDQEAVTRKAADLLGTCFHKLIIRGVPRDLAQSFTLQMLVALFAEDIGLLEKYFVTRLLEECKTPADAYDKLGNLFEAMNTPGGVRGGRFKGSTTSTAASSVRRPASSCRPTNSLNSAPPPTATGRKSAPKSSAPSSKPRWTRGNATPSAPTSPAPSTS